MKKYNEYMKQHHIENLLQCVCSKGFCFYLTQPLLLIQRVFRQLLPLCLHGQTHDVLSADGDQLLSLPRKYTHKDETSICQDAFKRPGNYNKEITQIEIQSTQSAFM